MVIVEVGTREYRVKKKGKGEDSMSNYSVCLYVYNNKDDAVGGGGGRR